MTADIGRRDGLCTTCRHVRIVVSGRGSRFVLCELSRTDARFPRYPPLPVIACAGFVERPSADDPPALDARGGGA